MGDDYVHGINKMKKPSTKVMAPPGGQTSINLFGGPVEPEQPKVNKCQASRNQSSIFGNAPEQKAAPAPAQPSTVTAAPNANVKSAPSQSTAPVENVQPQPQGPDGRPSTKVMAPPGGKTSINLFG